MDDFIAMFSTDLKNYIMICFIIEIFRTSNIYTHIT